MVIPPIFSSLFDKLNLVLNIKNNRINFYFIKVEKGGIVNLLQLEKELIEYPPKVKALEIRASDATTISEALQLEGSLNMIKVTKQPTKKELELVQQARGNRPYSSISSVHINYAESGNITSISWIES